MPKNFFQQQIIDKNRLIKIVFKKKFLEQQ